jgi:hypothetical protein
MARVQWQYGVGDDSIFSIAAEPRRRPCVALLDVPVRAGRRSPFRDPQLVESGRARASQLCLSLITNAVRPEGVHFAPGKAAIGQGADKKSRGHL